MLICPNREWQRLNTGSDIAIITPRVLIRITKRPPSGIGKRRNRVMRKLSINFVAAITRVAG